MLGSCFLFSDSAGPLEPTSFLRLLVLKGQQFKHLDYGRNVFHFPFRTSCPSPIALQAPQHPQRGESKAEDVFGVFLNEPKSFSLVCSGFEPIDAELERGEVRTKVN